MGSSGEETRPLLQNRSLGTRAGPSSWPAGRVNKGGVVRPRLPGSLSHGRPSLTAKPLREAENRCLIAVRPGASADLNRVCPRTARLHGDTKQFLRV